MLGRTDSPGTSGIDSNWLIVMTVWNHPFVTLGVSLAVLVAVMIGIRAVWKTIRRALSA